MLSRDLLCGEQSLGEEKATRDNRDIFTQPRTYPVHFVIILEVDSPQEQLAAEITRLSGRAFCPRISVFAVEA